MSAIDIPQSDKFNLGSGWCPYTNSSTEWVQISNVKQQIWQGIKLQGRADDMMYVKSLRIQYSDDGVEWNDIEPSYNYLARNATSDYEFKGLSSWNETQ